jgi:cytochrome c553
MEDFRKAMVGGGVALSFSILTWVGSALAQTPQGDTTTAAARTLATSVCAHCHGREGRSTDPVIPNLAGQHRAYIEVQLKAFRAQKRRDPEAHMWGITAAWLEDDRLVAEIANYFSSQSPAPGKAGDPTTVALGKQLYEKPNPERGFPNCAGCHGANAEGLSVFPRLAAQQTQYLVREMQMQRVGLRDAPPTHAALRGLTDDEIAALAAYLHSK